MAEHVISENTAEREDLVPVVLKIFGLYITIMTVGYFVGNAIYQIP
jgi:hypothetical protein